VARYLVLAPMPVELRPVVRTMGLRPAGDGAHRGTLAGAEVAAVLAGIGPAAAERAARRWIGALEPTHVLVVGVAGGVRPDLAIGSLVVPATVQAVDDADPTALGPARRAHPLGGVALAGALITTRDLITERAVHDAHQAQGIDAVDMETAAIAAVSDELGLPWTAFRGISDHVDEGLLADPAILGLLGPDGAPKPAAAAKAVLRRPTILRSFVRLGIGSTKATRAAAAGARRAIEEDAATS
jgi:hypothetical protein